MQRIFAGSEPASAQPTASAPDEGTPAPTTAATTGAACDLLTAAEAEAATGQQNVAAQPVAASDTDAAAACGYVAGGLVTVMIVTILGPETDRDPASYHSLPGTADIAVGGAKAVYVPAAGQVLFVFKGTTAVAVQFVTSAPGDDGEATARKLVQKVADRIP